MAQSTRKKRQSVHDQNRPASLDVKDASTETCDGKILLTLWMMMDGWMLVCYSFTLKQLNGCGWNLALRKIVVWNNTVYFLSRRNVCKLSTSERCFVIAPYFQRLPELKLKQWNYIRAIYLFEGFKSVKLSVPAILHVVRQNQCTHTAPSSSGCQSCCRYSLTPSLNLTSDRCQTSHATVFDNRTTDSMTAVTD